MELLRVETRAVPGEPGRVRLVGEVVYDDRPHAREEFWFEVDESLSHSLSRSANPWLAALLPLAATLHEPLRLRLPLDPLLRASAAELNAIWRAWYPWLGGVAIEADTLAAPPGVDGERLTGAFFSGGVDSFYMVMRRLRDPRGILCPQELICIAGFDVPLARRPERLRRRERLAGVAESLGVRLVEVATNIKETRLATADWNDLWHGCGVLATGLALERRYRRLMIAATFDYGHLKGLGSHPLTDPLLSTRVTRVLHEGAAATRFGKVEYIAGLEGPLQALHVCWKQESDENCGRCEKCLRTMIMLELAGALGRATTFPERKLDLDRVSRILLKRDRSYDTYYREVSRLALQIGRLDIHRAIESCNRASRLRRRAVSLSQSWKTKRVLWRAARRLHSWALQGRVA
jgi:hypothetical protein